MLDVLLMASLACFFSVCGGERQYFSCLLLTPYKAEANGEWAA